LYLLSTDLPENDHLARTITERLYDNNLSTRIAQSIVLGIGGGKVIEALGGADIYHINEGHALPLAFYLKNEKYKTEAELKKHFVFTTHTPELAGNEEHNAQLLNEMNFFGKHLTHNELAEVTHHQGSLNYTVTALRCAKIANGVSQLHGEVAREMWKDYDGICPIIAITNAQDKEYWADKELHKHWEKGQDKAYESRKKELKRELFEIVSDQTGKHFDPNVLTIVWARRFAAYKRADLLLRDMARFKAMITNLKTPVQIIWAGKPYPLDGGAMAVFNSLVKFTKDIPNCAVLTGYELNLSHWLKLGADVWLNTPRRPREASGTSGMTAAMNGAINCSIFDGWICEFVKHGVNGFTVEPTDMALPQDTQDDMDCRKIYDTLEKEVIPAYYDKTKWNTLIKQSMTDVLAFFEADRMADEYYTRLYNA
jgi:starch phosphorylase